MFITDSACCYYFVIYFFETNCTPSGKKMVCNFKCVLAHPSMHTIEVWMVKPLSVAGKHCGYMLSTEFTQVLQLCTLNLCGLHFLSCFFLSTWGIICCCFFFPSRGVYLPNPDPTEMEMWEKEWGREK